ncbi:hypothetical protein [Paramicrobacterium chengjingii]|uniref:Uncharacterized protein n=1 Tax=Paramicrobacterium chengjingii TaxID=2769067 RepID=A0ABX6YF90_9MICO|nr:hypothetical protein [Microbacterium chengjingii]QPZ37462.1 hypothetical protein HCR76_11520 [Microbacterium chengjingii]
MAAARDSHAVGRGRIESSLSRSVLVTECFDQYRLTGERAVEIIADVATAVESWSDVADTFIGDKGSIPAFAVAFDNDNTQRAAELAPRSAATVIGSFADGDLGSSRSGRTWVPSHIRNGRKVEGYWRH